MLSITGVGKTLKSLPLLRELPRAIRQGTASGVLKDIFTPAFADRSAAAITRGEQKGKLWGGLGITLINKFLRNPGALEVTTRDIEHAEFLARRATH